jgi:acyl-CoA thioesterase I
VVYRGDVRRARIAIAVAAVVVAVAAGVVGYRLLAPHVRSVVAGAGAAAGVVAATPSPPALKVATIGDSIMSGNGLDPSEAWPVLLSASTGAAVANLGCGGAGFVAVGECDTDYSGLVAEAAAGHPDVVIIQSSDNDFGEDDDDIAAATTATVASIRAALPDARIIGLSTLWDQPGELPDQVASTSDDLRTAVEAVGGTFIDLGQPLADQAAENGEYDAADDSGSGDSGDDGDSDGDEDDAAPTPTPTPAPSPTALPQLLQPDFEHPTAAGQQLLAEAIAAALDAAGIHL